MNKHKDYFMMPNKIFDLQLKPRDFIVYCCLVRHKDNNTETFRNLSFLSVVVESSEDDFEDSLYCLMKQNRKAAAEKLSA